jgi:hypothetical protein
MLFLIFKVPHTLNSEVLYTLTTIALLSLKKCQIKQ